MGYQSEAELENKLIEKLKTQGYERVLINDYAELENNFREQLNKFNIIALENKPLTDKEFERVLNVLNGKSVLQSAIKLREKIDFDREDGTKIYLKLLSENAEDNIYQVSNQITVQGKYKNRYDVTILINGLPLVQIELKRSGIDINEAINQIDRYRIHSYRGLFHYIQIYVVSNSVETRYFANTDAQRLLKSLTFYWTTETNERINKLEDFSSSFFNKARLLKNVIRYMVINETDKTYNWRKSDYGEKGNDNWCINKWWRCAGNECCDSCSSQSRYFQWSESKGCPSWICRTFGRGYY